MRDSGFFLLCNKCGEEVNKTDKVCKKCGSIINWNLNQGYTLYCENCSQVIQKGSDRCSNCGSLISWQEMEQNLGQNFANGGNFYNNSNMQFRQEIKQYFRGANWIKLCEVMAYLSWILIAILGGFLGMLLRGGIWASPDEQMVGFLFGLLIGAVVGAIAVSVQMLIIGVAKDIRDIRNKICS